MAQSPTTSNYTGVDAIEGYSIDGTKVLAASGNVRVGNLLILKQAAPTAKTVTVTLTTAEILIGMITANQAGAASATYTTPTGTLLDAALPSEFAVDDSFDFIIVNISTVAAEDVTLAGGTGVTTVGNMVVASNAVATDQSAATFRFRKTAANAFSVYRIA